MGHRLDFRKDWSPSSRELGRRNLLGMNKHYHIQFLLLSAQKSESRERGSASLVGVGRGTLADGLSGPNPVEKGDSLVTQRRRQLLDRQEEEGPSVHMLLGTAVGPGAETST